MNYRIRDTESEVLDRICSKVELRALDLSKSSDRRFVDNAIIQSPAQQIAELQARLHVAEQRARVAEEQLQRVHEAVRAFKQKQIRARAAQAEAAKRSSTAAPSSYFDGLETEDPSLDERLSDFLESEFEPDRSRSWMLSR